MQSSITTRSPFQLSTYIFYGIVFKKRFESKANVCLSNYNFKRTKNHTLTKQVEIDFYKIVVAKSNTLFYEDFQQECVNLL